METWETRRFGRKQNKFEGRSNKDCLCELLQAKWQQKEGQSNKVVLEN